MIGVIVINVKMNLVGHVQHVGEDVLDLIIVVVVVIVIVQDQLQYMECGILYLLCLYLFDLCDFIDM